MPELKKEISLLGLLALGASGIIGTSWIYTNSKFFSLYGAGGEIFGIAIATVFVVFIALAYAELTSIFPRAGGGVVYSYIAFNRSMAFIAGWMLLGAFLASLAFYVMASGMLLSWAFPALEQIPLYSIAGTPVYLPVFLFGFALTFLLFGVNYRGVKLSSRIQIGLFSIMIVLGLVLVIVGFAHGSVHNFWPAYPSGSSPTLLTLRFMLPALTYLTGFAMVAILAEEANLPSKRIGLLVILSVLVAGLFYFMVLLSSAWVYPWQETAQLEKGTIDAFTSAGFPALGWSAYAISFLGMLTSFLALFLTTPRIIFSMSRAGILPELFTKLHPKYGTPVNALWFTLILTLGLGWLGKAAIVWFLDIGGIFIGIAWIIGVLCMLEIRKKYPKVERPYRVPAHYIFAAIGIIMTAIVIIISLIPGTSLSLVWPYEYGILIVWIIIGVVIYMVTPKYRSDKEALKELLGEYYDKIRR